MAGYGLINHDGFQKFKKNGNNSLYLILNEFINGDEKEYGPICGFGPNDYGHTLNGWEKMTKYYFNEMVKDGYEHHAMYTRDMALMNMTQAEADLHKMIGDEFEGFSSFSLQFAEHMAQIMGLKKGSVEQICDALDRGVDIRAIWYAYNKKIFGQIKKRDFFNEKINSNNYYTAFCLDTLMKLQFWSEEFYGFDKTKDVLLFITNLPWNRAFHFALADQIGLVNGQPDNEHSYIKIVDRSTFDFIIAQDNIKFWNEYLKAIGK